ncbi:hypothetical protein GYH30_037564 [Glycine max]|nr:hypothetical protein GYH30_037564 [Glycine max]
MEKKKKIRRELSGLTTTHPQRQTLLHKNEIFVYLVQQKQERFEI